MEIILNRSEFFLESGSLLSNVFIDDSMGIPPDRLAIPVLQHPPFRAAAVLEVATPHYKLNP